MAPQPRPLTKSRFKTAMKCPTQLYYSNHDVYFDARTDDDFLKSLADGGLQVGEMAKYFYHPDPVGEHITVEQRCHDTALTETAMRLAAPGRIVIAEAAIGDAEFFIRVDILIRDEASRTIEIIEVKSKSVKQADVDVGFRNSNGYDPRWVEYLYDIAFQAVVAERFLPGYRIVPKLLLVDTDVACDRDALHQCFQIVGENQRTDRSCVRPIEGLSRGDLGSLGMLREVDLTSMVVDLRNRPVPVSAANLPASATANLEAFMGWCSGLQQADQRFFARPNKTCKSCTFKNPPPDSKMLDGMRECWIHAGTEGWLRTTENGASRAVCADDLSQPLAIELWGGDAGAKSLVGDALALGRALVRDINPADIAPGTIKRDPGISAFRRRELQIDAARSRDFAFEIDEAILGEMDRWEWPLHMIDFETSAPAIPFFEGMRPYQVLAFQFSHHILEKASDGRIRIRHATQWISTDGHAYPNIEFVRALRSALMPDGCSLSGTVFRYHNHENTVLRKLREEIDGRNDLPDRGDLLRFIDLITHVRNGHCGPKDMVDLHRVVKKGYYSKVAGGSISLKRILPAIIHDAPGLVDLFGTSGIYGNGLLIESLNFAEHVWITEKTGRDPYKTLLPVFSPDTVSVDPRLFRLSQEAEDDEDERGTAITAGGVAMSAYNYTQYADLAPADREHIRQALLRYCELDTLAMVMLVQGLFELRGRPLRVV